MAQTISKLYYDNKAIFIYGYEEGQNVIKVFTLNNVFQNNVNK